MRHPKHRKILPIFTAAAILIALSPVIGQAQTSENQSPEQAYQLKLITGETLSGTLISQDDKQIVFKHPVLGEIVVPKSKITAPPPTPTPTPSVSPANPKTPVVEKNEPAAKPAPVKKPAPKPAAKPAPAKPTPPKPADKKPALEAKSDKPGFFDDWKKRIELGLNGSEGNSTTTNFRIAFKANKADKTDRWDFRSHYYLGTSRGNTNRNQAEIYLNKDWLLPESSWFTFVRAQYKFDKFAAWEHRISTFAGFGFTLFDTDDFRMETRIGGGATHEFGDENQTYPEGLLSTSIVKWKINKSHSLSGSVDLYPDLAEEAEFRMVTRGEWLIKIDHARGMKLKIGIENEYESETNGSAENNDLKYYGALVLDF